MLERQRDVRPNVSRHLPQAQANPQRPPRRHYLEEHPEESKKTVAAALGASSADLSHWLSRQTGYTMPAHLVPLFFRVVGENSLLWHLQDQYEKGRVA